MFVNARCMCTVFKIQLYSCARARKSIELRLHAKNEEVSRDTLIQTRTDIQTLINIKLPPGLSM